MMDETIHIFLCNHAHAQSAENAPEGCESQAALTEKGRKQISALSALLAPKAESIFEDVSEVWHSPFVCSQQMAQQLTKELKLGSDVDVHEVHELEHDEPTEPLAKLMAESEGDVILCGHQTELERLATCLIVSEPGLGVVHLEPGSMLCLQRITHASEAIPYGFWQIQWLVPVG